jgi:hypothetical protein
MWSPARRSSIRCRSWVDRRTTPASKRGGERASGDFYPLDASFPICKDGTGVAPPPRVRPLARLLILTAAGFCTACSPYARVLPLGASLPSRPPNCELAYELIAPADAQAQWRQVGEVCLTDSPFWSAQPRVVDVYQPGDMHDLLTERACALGGQSVTPIALCANGKRSGIAFGVYVPR